MGILLITALTFYLGAMLYSFFVFATKAVRPNRELQVIVWLGFLTHTAALLLGWSQAGHFPIVNPREVSSFISWAIVGYFLLTSKRYQIRALPVFLLPLVYLFALVSMILPDSAEPMPDSLEGAITANSFTKIIFPIHVALVIFSYAAFVVTLEAWPATSMPVVGSKPVMLPFSAMPPYQPFLMRPPPIT